jgi:predicted alpha/beta-fold hydrolase
MVTQFRYRPAWWIPGPHARTVWGRFVRRVPSVATRRERWETPDGDLLDIERLDAPPDRPRLVLLHGLEGTVRSHYAQGTLAEAQRRGWGADFVLFRSCGGTINRARRFYHSGETGDLALVIDRVTREHPRAPLVLAGFSLGGNVLLKYLGERGDDVPRAIRAAAAVSVPFDLDRGASYIDRGFARVYQASFLKSLKRKAYAKLAVYPDLCDRARLDAVRSIRDFDEFVTAPLHGFAGASDYYAQSSSLGFLGGVRRPTLLLSAVDDPFLPPAVLDDVRAVAAENPALTVEFVPEGGHVGFISGTVPWRPEYYAERRVAEFLDGYVSSRLTMSA